MFSPVLGRDREVIMEGTSLRGSVSHPERNSALAELMLMLLVLLMKPRV